MFHIQLLAEIHHPHTYDFNHKKLSDHSNHNTIDSVINLTIILLIDPHPQKCITHKT